jgi:hypothetical protein
MAAGVDDPLEGKDSAVLILGNLLKHRSPSNIETALLVDPRISVQFAATARRRIKGEYDNLGP